MTSAWMLLAVLPYLCLGLFADLEHTHGRPCAPSSACIAHADLDAPAMADATLTDASCAVCQWHLVASACLVATADLAVPALQSRRALARRMFLATPTLVGLTPARAPPVSLV